MDDVLTFASAFRWVEDAANFDVSALDSPTGYIVRIYCADRSRVSAASICCDQHISFLPNKRKNRKRKGKFLATLYDKQRYVIPYHNL